MQYKRISHFEKAKFLSKIDPKTAFFGRKIKTDEKRQQTEEEKSGKKHGKSLINQRKNAAFSKTEKTDFDAFCALSRRNSLKRKKESKKTNNKNIYIFKCSELLGKFFSDEQNHSFLY